MLFRMLALDLGKKRIGLAVSDPLGVTAQGLPTYARVNLRADLLAIHLKAKELDASAILMGLPKSLQGEEARQAQWVREFGARLEERSGLPVFYWDERFTSVEAERVLKLKRGGPAGSKSRLLQKGQVDRLAAVLLLQSYLDAGLPGVGIEEGAEPGDLLDGGEFEERDLPEPTVPLPEPARPRGGKRWQRAWDDDSGEDEE